MARRVDYDEAYKPKARSRLVPGPKESLRRMTWLRVGRFGAGRSARPARIAVRPPRSYRRRCLVQGTYVQDGRMVRGKPIDLQASSRRHLAYIEREGVERDGSAGRLYDAAIPQPAETAARVRAGLASPLPGEKHQFRFIISPEDAGQVELTEFVQELMSRVERDLGQPLIWGSVNHFNTAHPHAHVVIRGVDRNGREVRFDPEYIKRGFRSRAEELATELLGPRTELEYQQQLESEVEQQRYTTLDRGINAKARDGSVRLEDLSEVQRKRMHFLEALGLAERAQGSTRRMRDGWDRKLRRLGERGDLIKQMHQALREVDSTRFVICGQDVPKNAIEGDIIHGRIATIGLRDNVPDGMFACVETVRGSGYYLPLSPAQVDVVREGNLVILRRWMDRRGRARLSIDKSRLSLEQQVTYVGPTWLDTAKPSGTTPLAHEVQQKRAAREVFLRERELWGRSLAGAERRRLTDHYARKLDKARATRWEGFIGRVVAIHRADSGYNYAVIASDREVMLMRATREAERMLERDVRVVLSSDRGPDRKPKTGQRIEVQPLEQSR